MQRDEPSIKKVLYNQVSLGIAVCGVLFGVFSFLQTPKTDISLIQADIQNLKDNHLHTIEENQKTMQRELQDLTLQVGKLATVIEERIPQKK